jgi:hypothetical protein
MGNAWLPPQGWRLYLPHEIASLFGTSKRNILWAGDSTTRRTALTWYALLQEAVPQQQQQQTNKTSNDTKENEENNHYYYLIPHANLASNRVVNVGKQDDDVECQRFPRRNINRPRICRPLPTAAAVGQRQDQETNFSAASMDNSTSLYEMWVIKVNCLGEGMYIYIYI